MSPRPGIVPGRGFFHGIAMADRQEISERIGFRVGDGPAVGEVLDVLVDLLIDAAESDTGIRTPAAGLNEVTEAERLNEMSPTAATIGPMCAVASQDGDQGASLPEIVPETATGRQ